jgi:hypothetical protein
MKLLVLGFPLFLLLFSAISWSAGKVRNLPLFRVDHVVVEGAVPLEFNDLIGASIFDFSFDDLKTRYEDEQTKIVRMKRLYPSSIVVETARRTPFAVLELQKRYVVDVDGYVLGDASSLSDDEIDPLPVVQVFSKRDPMEIWRLKARRVLDVVTLFAEELGGLHEVELYDDNLVVKTTKEIHLGQDRWLERVERLSAIRWRKLGEQEIDLRFKNQIVVRK